MLLDQVAEPAARHWYITAAVTHGWSRATLTHHIKTERYERINIAPNNFPATSPPASDWYDRERELGRWHCSPDNTSTQLDVEAITLVFCKARRAVSGHEVRLEAWKPTLPEIVHLAACAPTPVRAAANPIQGAPRRNPGSARPMIPRNNEHS